MDAGKVGPAGSGVSVGSGVGAAVAVAEGVDAGVGVVLGVGAVTVVAGVAGLGVEVAGAATVGVAPVGVAVANAGKGVGTGVGMSVGAMVGGVCAVATGRAGVVVDSDSQAISPTIKAITATIRMKLSTLRAQIGIVYLFAGIAKLNADWLLNAEPLRIWLFNNTDTPIFGPLLRETWVPYTMSWAGAFFDLTIVGWLLWRKTRPYAYVVLVAFHLTTALFFPSIGMFPWIMIGATLIFFDPDWPRQLLRRFKRKPQRMTESVISSVSAAACRPAWPVLAAGTLCALFFAVQILIPLRHLAYPGNVRWTEEGYLFSWRVLVTEKTGLVKFRVSSPELQSEQLVYPEEYLTPLQVELMAYEPDMILATAHIIRDDFIARGYNEIEVRADAFVTFNGRPAARLIDASADLARVTSGLGPKPWILEAPS